MNFINGQLKKFGRQPAKLALLISLVLFGLLLVNLPEGLAEIQTTESEWLKATGFNPWDHIVTIFGNLLILFITLVGHLLLFFMKMVAELFQYNNFIHAQAVEIGWPLMRDLMNIAFVIILLIVAFSTILHISRYHYKGILWKLIIMAILVNFSKTILGFIIDFTQVIMMTFVNGFKAAMEINLANSFGVGNLLQFDDKAVAAGDLDKNSLIMGLILALALVVVACFVMVVYMVVLLWRIISLWVAVILSPLAFVGQAFPGLQKQAADFWSKFWNILTVGVAMAFFMWLSLTILAASSNVAQEFNVNKETADTSQLSGGQAATPAVSQAVAVTKASNPENLFTYIVAIVLLLMGLQYAQQAGGFAGKFAGAAMSGLSKLGKTALKSPMLPINAGIDKLQQKSGVDLNVKRNWANFQEGRKARKEKAYKEGIKASDKRIKEGGFVGSRLAAMTTGVSEHMENYGYLKGGLRMMRGLGRGATRRAKEKSDEAEEAKKKEEASLALAQGGSQDYYQKNRLAEIDNERQTKMQESEKLRGEGKSDEAANIDKELRQLDEEEINLRAVLTFASVDSDVLEGADLDRFYEQQGNNLTEEQKSIEEEETSIKYKKKKVIDPVTGKAELDDEGNEKFELVQKKDNEITAEDKVRLKELEAKKEIITINQEDLSKWREAVKDKTTQERIGSVGGIRDAVAKKSDQRLQNRKEAVATRLSTVNGVLASNNTDVLTGDEVDEREAKITKLNEKRERLKVDIMSAGTPDQKQALGKELETVEKDIKESSIHDDGLYYLTTSEKTELQKDKEKKKKRSSNTLSNLRKEKTDLESQQTIIEEQEKSPRHFTDIEKEKYQKKAEEYHEQVQKFKAKSAKAMPTSGFNAQMATRQLQSEEMKKVEGTESDTELLTMLNEAMVRKDKARIGAIMKKMANDYNDNEFLNNFGYESTSSGMRDFFEKELKGKAGFGDQEMLSLANDISYINESRSHYNTARMTTMENGRWRWYSEREHIQVATSEITKQSDRTIANKLNRLGYGGERADGSYVMSGTGAAILRQHVPAWLQNPRIIMEHLNGSVVEKLMEAERREGSITKAIGDIVVKVDGKNVNAAKGLIDAFKQRLGSSGESVADTAARVVQHNFGYSGTDQPLTRYHAGNESERDNESTNRIITNVKSSPSQENHINITNTVRALRESTAPEKTGYLNFTNDQNLQQFWIVRNLLKKLHNNMKETAMAQGTSYQDFGVLGNRIEELDHSLPNNPSTSLKDIAASVKNVNASEDEIRRIVERFVSIGSK